MLRLVLGLIKGAVVGGGIGYGLYYLHFTGSFMAYLACAAVGALVGLVAGRAPWKAETIWTPVVKMVVGAAVGIGLAAAGLHFLPAKAFAVPKLGEMSLASGPVLALAVGLIYGMFVELDDGGQKGVENADGKQRKKA